MNYVIHDLSKEMRIPFHSAGVAQKEKGSRYIVWQIVSDIPGATIGYRSNVSKVRIQFDIYTRDEEAAFEVTKRLEKEMLGKGLVLFRNAPFFDVETKMYRRTVDMSILQKGMNDE